MPHVCWQLWWTDLFYPATYSGDTTVFPYYGGSIQYSSSYLESNHGLATQATSVTYKNIILNGYLFLKYGLNLKPDVRLGNIYSRSDSNDDNVDRVLRHDEGASSSLPLLNTPFAEQVLCIQRRIVDVVLQPVPEPKS